MLLRLQQSTALPAWAPRPSAAALSLLPIVPLSTVCRALLQDDLKSLEMTIHGPPSAAAPDDEPAAAIDTDGAHGRRKWDVQVVPAAKAEASQIWGLFPDEERGCLRVHQPFDRQVHFVERPSVGNWTASPGSLL